MLGHPIVWRILGDHSWFQHIVQDEFSIHWHLLLADELLLHLFLQLCFLLAEQGTLGHSKLLKMLKVDHLLCSTMLHLFNAVILLNNAGLPGHGCLTLDDHWAWPWSDHLIIWSSILPPIPNWSGATTSSGHSPDHRTNRISLVGYYILHRGWRLFTEAGGCNVSTKSHFSVKRCASWLWDFSSASHDPHGPKHFLWKPHWQNPV